MDEEKFEALVELIEAIAHEAAGQAINQPCCKDNVIEAKNRLRTLLELPLVERN